MKKEQKLEMYRYMYLSRRVEERLSEMFAANLLAGWVHLGMGQEVGGSALAMCMKPDDYLAPYHRSRISVLGKGVSLKALLAEIGGKTTGTNRGLGGEAHVMDPEAHVYGTGGLIGRNIPIGLGLGYACMLEGKDRITVCGFGEGGSCTGSFHEALNMAAVWNLPILFVCENNGYAEFTPQRGEMKIKDVADRAKAYGMASKIIDGNEAEAAYEAIHKAVDAVRAGKGPMLLEIKTYRYHGHFEGDSCAYRTREEEQEWLAKDPVKALRGRLAKEAGEKPLAEIEAAVEAEIEEAVNFMMESPTPTKEQVLMSNFA